MRSTAGAALAIAFASASALAADVVVTPPGGGGFAVTHSATGLTRFHVADDGTVSLSGPIYVGGEWYLHNSGNNNTFLGLSAGTLGVTGSWNSGAGMFALQAITTGNANTAAGEGALRFNTGGSSNTAIGRRASYLNVTGNGNVAIGSLALATSTGSSNVAVGASALQDNETGTNNIALGAGAGIDALGSFNILIGHGGVAADNSTIRVGTSQTRAFIAGIRGRTTGTANAIPVMIDSTGQLGTVSSSGRFKDDIADMDEASSDLMKLRPVTFHYLADQDPAGRTLQYGLVAEEVAEVYPGLVARSNDGQVETVMYQFLPSMLLNEVQKLHREVAALRAELASNRRHR